MPVQRCSSTSRIPELDVLRGIAISLVLVHHAPLAISSSSPGGAVLGAIKDMGWSGVDLFFVLSGFLISGLLFNEFDRTGRIRVGRFLLRRGMKIWPAYYVVFVGLVLYTVLERAVNGEVNSITLFLKHFWWGLYDRWPYWIFVQNYTRLATWQHTWSLAVEEHFYLSFALLLWVTCHFSRARGDRLHRSRLPLITLAISLVVLGARVATWWSQTGPSPVDPPIQIHVVSHLRIDGLLFGTCLSYVYRYRRRTVSRLKAHLGWLFGLSFLLILPLFLWPVRSEAGARLTLTLGFTLNYLGYGGILIGCLLVDWSRCPARIALIGGPVCRVLRFLGVYSYTIYLIHLAYRDVRPAEWLGRVLGHVGEKIAAAPFADLTMYLIFAILGGVLVSRVIERPVLRWRERALPSSRRANAASSYQQHTGAVPTDNPKLVEDSGPAILVSLEPRGAQNAL